MRKRLYVIADRMSASQVSRICEALDETVADLRKRTFEGVRFPYLWIDAACVKCRDGGHVCVLSSQRRQNRHQRVDTFRMTAEPLVFAA